ncbi:MAG: hypothetical protein ACRDOA_04625 [Streptosporangiaceae bacterium]
MNDRRSASRLFQVLGWTTQISIRYRTKASRSCTGAFVDRQEASAATANKARMMISRSHTSY